MNAPKEEIWKFMLSTHETEQRYEWPYIKAILDIQVQDGQVVLWAIVYPDTAKCLYKIMRFLTGDLTYGINGYLGTVQLNGYVLHYFSGGPGL